MSHAGASRAGPRPRACSLRGQGGPPLFTDDPGTPGAGNWEVNVALTLDRVPGASTWGTPLVDANYGWGERVQLKLEVPWVVLSSGSGTKNGFGNPLFGVKWRFLDEETAGVAVSTYPQYGFNLLTSSGERGLADEDPHFLFPVSAATTLGPVAINLEAGHVFRRDARAGIRYPDLHRSFPRETGYTQHTSVFHGVACV